MRIKKTLRNINPKKLQGKKILFRVAYDVPLKERGGKYRVSDDRRIKSTLPTLRYLLKNKACIVIMTWLKRPKGEVVEKYRLDPVAKHLSKLIKRPVKKIDDCVGDKAKYAINHLKSGQILMLENTRFHKEEQQASPAFSKKLVQGIDMIVFDAFGQSHRVHASTTGILRYKPAVAGFLLEKELKALDTFIHKPKKPFILVLGGAKISDKVHIIEHLIKKSDIILTGGGLANTFLAAQGVKTANSLIESGSVDQAKGKTMNSLDKAREIIMLAKKSKSNILKTRILPKIMVPFDFIASSGMEGKMRMKIIDLEKGDVIPDKWQFFDIGPKTISLYVKIIKKSKSVVWNGPVGLFENKKFSRGTEIIARALSQSKAKTIVCGGDTEKIVEMYKLETAFYHVSTGGGASLEYLAGKKLPALQALLNKNNH